MAIFEGNEVEFYNHLSSWSTTIVTKLARPYREKQKSCKQLKDDGEKCRKLKSLDAAHLKHATRKIMFNEILKVHATKNTDTKTYKIDLALFEEKFKEKHEKFLEVVEFMCRKHHRMYDNKHKIAEDESDYSAIDVEVLKTNDIEIESTTRSKEIKKIVLNRVDYLNSKNCAIARISNDKWNFNTSKNSIQQDFYLICYNQFDFTVAIVKIEGKMLSPERLIKKSDKTQISINIPYSDTKFIEMKTQYEFELIEMLALKEN